jgi:hypothetical protein
MPPEPTVYLISCVKTKQPFRCQAKDLYISDFFSKARNHAEASKGSWFILSAEYGLLSPDRMVAPYERTLNKMPKRDREAWAQKVLLQIEAELPDLKRVVFLAGERYRENLVHPLRARGVKVAIPMEGLGIGKQLRWLKQNSPSPEQLHSS